MKLLTKHIRINILLVAVVFLLSSLTLNYLIKDTLISELDEVLSEIKTRADYYTQTRGKIPINSSLDDYQIHYEATSYPSSSSTFTTIPKLIRDKNKIQNYRELVYTSKIGSQLYRVTINKPIEGMKHMVSHIINLSIITILLVILFLVLVNRFILARLWRPFYQSLEMMAHFQLNKQNHLDFPETTTLEFKYMNDILKRSFQKAGEDYVALKEFTENASHELQTPLAIISSKLDLLIQDENLSEKQEAKIMSAYAALKRMSQLNQSLLLSAKIGNQQFTTANTISFKQKINEKLDQFHELWEGRISIKAILDESFVIMNKDLNETLINNLLSNATKHNMENGFIEIELSPGTLSIKNPGIDKPLDPAKIFQRFYKSEQNSLGNGLGLSIIKQICDASGLKIEYSFQKNLHCFVLTWENKKIADHQKKNWESLSSNSEFKYSLAS